MISRDDLEWWLRTAPTLDWKVARTMPDAPHSYVVRDRTLDSESFDRAVKVIHTFGQPGKFYSRTQVYLTHSGLKWWTMGRDVEGQGVINQATTDRVYGRQDAPVTETGTFTVYDGLAKEYDDRYTSPECVAENLAVRRLVTKHFGAYAPTVLDVGCGTGLLLDLGITSPALFTGVDPSRGMLNELVWKHPKVSRVIPSSMEEALPSLRGRKFDLVASLFGSPSYIDPRTLRELPGLSDGMTLLMHYVEGYAPDYEKVEDVEHHAASREMASALGGEQFHLGKFVVTVVT